MCPRDVTLEVGDKNFPGRLNVPDRSSEHGVLMVPGSGHGPFGDIFLRFARTAAKDGHHVARFETWPFPEVLEEKTEEDFSREIDASVDFLQSQGCSTVTVVAKSFGGRVVLEHLPETVDRLVLWAPAIMAGDYEEKPSLTEEELADIDIPVRILQGDEDEVVSVENAASLVDGLPNGELVELSGENHSFRGDYERIIDETMAFLPDQPS
ncbi:alpha/beta hydrolase [Halovenus rubra]|uniref:Alpha/beta hydrolase n=2 Tax=Halovenus rubra TaxID=869890 RepID=A0ABD5X8N1_9EURY|nr:alpha/beta family hydrolase [Halovenus rubra]